MSILVGYLIAGVSFRKLQRKVRLSKLINYGLVGTSFVLFLLFLTSLIFRRAPGLGFYVSCFLCILLGFNSNIVQMGYFSIINFVPEIVVARFTLGTAVGGLFLTILRIIIFAIAKSRVDLVLPILIYFGIATGIQIFDLILNVRFCKTSFYKRKI